MTFRSVYFITLIIISFSYGLLFFATYFPNWIEVYSIDLHNHFHREEYGLFFVCRHLPPVQSIFNNDNTSSLNNVSISNLTDIDSFVTSSLIELQTNNNNDLLYSCLRFPDPHSQLCSNNPGLCDLWEIAASFSIFSIFVGAWCLAGLSEIVLGDSAHRSRGWAFLFVFLALFGIAKFFLLLIVYRLEADPEILFKPLNDPRWWDIHKGFSFRMTFLSLLFDVSAMIFLILTHRTLRPTYQEIP